MKFNKHRGPINHVGRNFSKCDAVSKMFNLENNKRMKIHENKCIVEANVTKKALKIDKKVKYGAQ